MTIERATKDNLRLGDVVRYLPDVNRRFEITKEAYRSSGGPLQVEMHELSRTNKGYINNPFPYEAKEPRLSQSFLKDLGEIDKYRVCFQALISVLINTDSLNEVSELLVELEI